MTNHWLRKQLLSHSYFIVRNSSIHVFYRRLAEFENLIESFTGFKTYFTLYHTLTTFGTLGEKAFENIVGKGENAMNQLFLLFPQCFLPSEKQTECFEHHLICRLQTFSIWTRLNFAVW